MATPLLELKQLQTYFFSAQGTRIVKAVDGVSFALAEGETLGVVGESGSGKTVTSLSILRLLPTAARIVGGEILFAGENLLTKSERDMQQIRGSQISMILQDPMMSLNPLFTIGEQIAEPLREHLGMKSPTIGERIKELLRGVRIPSPEVRMREYPHQMSGGMRQRIVGAISISCEPRLIIAEATLSFLGVGVAPPQPAWGLMLSEGKAGLMAGYWWLSVIPGLCIMLIVLAANLLGDWFRVWSDPQLRQL